QAVWDRKGITGTYNFLVKIIKKFESRKKNQKDFSVELSKLSKKVSDKIESFNLNTIVSDFMKFSNSIDLSEMSTDNWKKFLICLSPLAPHTSEYLFNKIEKSKSIFKQKWPEYSLDKKDKSDIIVQVNGKKKDIIFVTPNTTKSSIIKKALKKISDRVKKDDIIKIIYIENKVINFVTK
ncbi:MAG: class I tRNA ligase family protein, partial [Bacillota bacterium]